jgi:hypothetical protein
MTRLHNQQLISTKFKKPLELISWLGAIQGQDYAGAKWALGLRLPGITDTYVEKEFAAKTLLRTWIMRGTLHIVSAADIHWMVNLLAPRIIKKNTRRYRELELDDDTLKQSNQVLKESLEGGTELNRKELLDILRKKGIDTEGQRAPYILQRASLDGLICQCGVDSNVPLYMSLDMIPESDMDDDEALAELTRRYFKSRGPATIQDFIWWSGLLTADARTGLEAVKSELNQETINGRTYWYSEEESSLINTEDPGANLPVVHLLPTYDEYFFAYRDRSASLDLKIRKYLQKHYRPTISLDGQIVGTWRRTFKKSRVLMEYHPFITLNRDEKHALGEAELLYRKFIE